MLAGLGRIWARRLARERTRRRPPFTLRGPAFAIRHCEKRIDEAIHEPAGAVGSMPLLIPGTRAVAMALGLGDESLRVYRGVAGLRAPGQT